MSLWVQWLGSGFLGALVLAVVNAVVNRRKLSADVTAILTKAASGVVERLEAENARVIASNTMLNGRVEAQQIQIDQVKTAVGIHAFWDNQAVETLREHGIDLPPPPPLNMTGS